LILKPDSLTGRTPVQRELVATQWPNCVRCPSVVLGAAVNERTAARGHANVVLVDAHRRLEQGNAKPRICLPQDDGKVPAL
jgi:hypothetical protein